MTIEIFHPEMHETAHKEAEIVIERLYKKSKVICLNGLKLKENRSIEFKYNKDGRNIYYVSDAGVKKLEKEYKVSHSILLD